MSAEQRFTPITGRGLPLPSCFLFFWVSLPSSSQVKRNPYHVAPVNQSLHKTHEVLWKVHEVWKVHEEVERMSQAQAPSLLSLIQQIIFLATTPQSSPTVARAAQSAFKGTTSASMSKLQLDSPCLLKMLPVSTSSDNIIQAQNSLNAAQKIKSTQKQYLQRCDSPYHSDNTVCFYLELLGATDLKQQD